MATKKTVGDKASKTPKTSKQSDLRGGAFERPVPGSAQAQAKTPRKPKTPKK